VVDAMVYLLFASLVVIPNVLIAFMVRDHVLSRSESPEQRLRRSRIAQVRMVRILCWGATITITLEVLTLVLAGLLE